MMRPVPRTIRRCLRSAARWTARAALAAFVLALAGFVAAWFALPFPREALESLSSSPVVTDASGREMIALVGADDQWRIPVPLERMSPWLIDATIAVEDRRFHDHGGVSLPAAGRAAWQNLVHGRRVSGASTITMQLCRMLDDRDRTLRAKMLESLRALQLEQIWPKRRILQAYLNLAPYGANIRGVEAASRLWFGKSAAQLSLAEAALLAGLPQSPQRYRPDRHLDRARRRQRAVLDAMVAAGCISPAQRDEAAAQPIDIVRRPNLGGGLQAAWLALQRRPGGGRTTIDLDLQQRLEDAVQRGLARLPDGTQAAAVLVDVEQAAIVALVGSADGDAAGGSAFNCATAWRSPGSALKPFVYAAAMDAHRLAPESLVYDVPIERGGWTPENFDRTFRGSLRADEALRISLNVPAILVAEAVGLDRCTGLMEACGVVLPPGAVQRGQLAAVTGAVEVRLVDLVNAYATLARGGVRRPLRLLADEQAPPARALRPEVAAAINHVLSGHARAADAAQPPPAAWCMWKTGTSSGRRDAWAVGHNGRYALGVWIGRLRGTGHAAYVGSQAAEPIFLDLIQQEALRGEAPPAPSPLVVVRPIGPPPDAGGGALRILRPAEGAEFVALDGEAIIRPLANRLGRLQWFLDGRLLEPHEAHRLVLPPGRHELRCIDGDGGAAAARFSVR